MQVVTADVTEIVSNPSLLQQTGTATVVPGTGAFFAQISTLQQIAAAPDAAKQLQAMIEALLEKEFEYAMAILDEDDTGIKNKLWFTPVPGGQHGPRIEVAIDPPNAVRRGGVMATVPFDPGKAAEGGPITKALERDVRDFIDLNRLVLMRYWNLEYSSTKKFIADLQPLRRR
jgi:hypothetical protein